MVELILLAIASAFWPVLLVVVLVSLRAPRPVRLLVATSCLVSFPLSR